MDRSFARSRRGFLGLGLSAAALATLGGLPRPIEGADKPDGSVPLDPWLGLKMGIATYTFSKLSTERAIEGIQRVGLHYCSIKDAHLPLKTSAERRKAVAKQFLDAGITPLSCGNISPGKDENSIRAVFQYAVDAGIPTIVCTPPKETIPILDRMVKLYDVKVAIHNHGPEDKIWPSPFDAWEAVESCDPRMGLCIDVGHTARCGVDPIDAIRKCSSRLHDVHIKDIADVSARSKPVELGRGVLDLRGILQALLDVKFPGHLGLEYEKDLNDPIPGTVESIDYLKGVLASMKRP